MFSKHPRRTLSPGNKYQTQIILLAFIPTLLLCLFLDLMSILIQSGAWGPIDRWIVLTVLIFSLLFVLSLILVFMLSRDLVGPFHRIIAELDEVIGGRSSKLLSARPRDELANELLKRINVLIQSHLDMKNK